MYYFVGPSERFKKYSFDRRFEYGEEIYTFSCEDFSFKGKKDTVFRQIKKIINDKKNLPSKRSKNLRKSSFDIRCDGLEKYYVGISVGSNFHYLKGYFESFDLANNYMVKYENDLINEWKRIKYIPCERKKGNAERVGENYRNGVDVSPSEFLKIFGFRGVEFGNYIEYYLRQSNLNETYDALLDLSKALKLSPFFLSLDNKLGLAFGSRGTGKASAHYETSYVVINMTKKNGPGCLAHEWFHALDDFFSRKNGFKLSFLSNNVNKYDKAHKIDDNIIQSWKNVINSIYGTDMLIRSKSLDKFRSTWYWSSKIELVARAFECYVIDKLKEISCSNDYLSNVLPPNDWYKLTTKDYPYPYITERQYINKAFDHLFETIRESSCFTA